MSNPTQEYTAYQTAYDYFDVELFGGRLLPCLITFQRKPHALGYSSTYCFAASNNRTHRTDQIASRRFKRI